MRTKPTKKKQSAYDHVMISVKRFERDQIVAYCVKNDLFIGDFVAEVVLKHIHNQN